MVLVSFGTRGDVQPFCVLGRELADRGHDVRVVTTGDYREMVGRFGLAAAETGAGFEAILREPEFEPLFRGYLSAGFGMIPQVRRLARRMQDRLADLMCATADAVVEADLVVHNPFAFFAGAFARELGRPTVGVLCQPMLPSRRTSLSLFGGRPLGGLGNRLSYESLRLVSPVARRAYAQVRRRRGLGRHLGLLANPLALDPTRPHPILAFSPALSPDPGDWPVSPTITGAWVKAIAPGTGLPEPVAAFLAAGPPPVYVGFGSMFWGARRNTEVVLRALDLWGGRAIVGTGTGGLEPPLELPARWLAIRSAEHGLLFPRVAAVVHHGGAGTTHAALRAGRPNVVLPLLGDQLYWGRRVAAVGAGEAPTALGRIEPEDLARRIARACDDPSFSAAAGRMARAMAEEPGVAAGADRIEAILREGVR